VSGHLQDLVTLHPQKELWYPLKKRKGGLQSWNGHFREEKVVYHYQDSSPAQSSHKPSSYTDDASLALMDRGTCPSCLSNGYVQHMLASCPEHEVGNASLVFKWLAGYIREIAKKINKLYQ
jgi:hypothetical protein